VGLAIESLDQRLDVLVLIVLTLWFLSNTFKVFGEICMRH
jgi:hypothetical protein